jgi:hypothetical protein
MRWVSRGPQNRCLGSQHRKTRVVSCHAAVKSSSLFFEKNDPADTVSFIGEENRGCWLRVLFCDGISELSFERMENSLRSSRLESSIKRILVIEDKPFDSERAETAIPSENRTVQIAVDDTGELESFRSALRDLVIWTTPSFIKKSIPP